VRVFTTCGWCGGGGSGSGGVRHRLPIIWIRGGPGWRRKAVDDGYAVELGEKSRRMKVKTGNSAVGAAIRVCERERRCVDPGRTTT